jgi:hypothetical protein
VGVWLQGSHCQRTPCIETQKKNINAQAAFAAVTSTRQKIVNCPHTYRKKGYIYYPRDVIGFILRTKSRM